MTVEEDDIDVRKRRAIYRANHRGTKEMDLIVGRYVNEKVGDMDEKELANIEEFMGVPDRDLEAWIMRGEFDADSDFADLVNRIRRYHGLGE